MLNTSKVAKHQFYNLFQNLKMSPIRTVDELAKVPQLPGSFIIWIDEAPPRCLFVGVASPKLEGGLLERLSNIIAGENKKNELHQFLARDGRLGKEYKLDLRKPENRTRFLHDHIYFQYLTIGDMKDDELKQFEEFLKESSELNPRYP
jgi:hypothetical protein